MSQQSTLELKHLQSFHIRSHMEKYSKIRDSAVHLNASVPHPITPSPTTVDELTSLVTGQLQSPKGINTTGNC